MSASKRFLPIADHGRPNQMASGTVAAMRPSPLSGTGQTPDSRIAHQSDTDCYHLNLLLPCSVCPSANLASAAIAAISKSQHLLFSQVLVDHDRSNIAGAHCNGDLLGHGAQITGDPDAGNVGISTLRLGLCMIARSRHFNAQLLCQVRAPMCRT